MATISDLETSARFNTEMFDQIMQELEETNYQEQAESVDKVFNEFSEALRATSERWRKFILKQTAIVFFDHAPCNITMRSFSLDSSKWYRENMHEKGKKKRKTKG